MIIGIPREIKNNEARVAITTEGVKAARIHRHEVLIEAYAGIGSGIADEEYKAAGAKIMRTAQEVWKTSDMIVKVLEPISEEYDLLRRDMILFTSLHLAGSRPLTEALLSKRTTSIGYESIQLEEGLRPILVPMSEIAGRLSVSVGSWALEAPNGGRGILLSGVSGVPPANILILGGGTVGQNAVRIAVGLGAHVTVIDINPNKLRYLDDIYRGRITTLIGNAANIEAELAQADLVIGAVLITDPKAPKIIKREHLKMMKPGSVIVDVSIDQGGIAETSRPTTHTDPFFVIDGILHYCVVNMPGAVPHTSTAALTNVTLPYMLAIADNGPLEAARQDKSLARGFYTYDGRLIHPGVATAFNLPLSELPSE